MALSHKKWPDFTGACAGDVVAFTRSPLGARAQTNWAAFHGCIWAERASPPKDRRADPCVILGAAGLRRLQQIRASRRDVRAGADRKSGGTSAGGRAGRVPRNDGGGAS